MTIRVVQPVSRIGLLFSSFEAPRPREKPSLASVPPIWRNMPELMFLPFTSGGTMSKVALFTWLTMNRSCASTSVGKGSRVLFCTLRVSSVISAGKGASALLGKTSRSLSLSGPPFGAPPSTETSLSVATPCVLPHTGRPPLLIREVRPRLPIHGLVVISLLKYQHDMQWKSTTGMITSLQILNSRLLRGQIKLLLE